MVNVISACVRAAHLNRFFKRSVHLTTARKHPGALCQDRMEEPQALHQQSILAVSEGILTWPGAQREEDLRIFDFASVLVRWKLLTLWFRFDGAQSGWALIFLKPTHSLPHPAVSFETDALYFWDSLTFKLCAAKLGIL